MINYNTYFYNSINSIHFCLINQLMIQLYQKYCHLLLFKLFYDCLKKLSITTITNNLQYDPYKN